MHNKETTNLKAGFINYMQGQILSGKLRPGDRIPPERTLAVQYGISRGSVNQGILDLERMGFLKIVPRKGTFVEDYLKKATPDTVTAIMGYDSDYMSYSLFKDLMDMRILIERECVSLACRRIDRESKEIITGNYEAVFKAGAAEIADALYEYHCCICETSGNAAYLMIFRSFGKMMRKLISIHYADGRQADVCLPEYAELTEAIINGNAEEADRRISSILGRASDFLNNFLKEKDGDNGRKKRAGN